MNQREVVAGNSWESTLAALWKSGRDVMDVPVKEGRSGWADSWMIIKGDGNRPCIYKWLNYVSSPKAQAMRIESRASATQTRRCLPNLMP